MKTSFLSREEQLVVDALTGERITWRTMAGIARDTGLTEGQVREILERYESDLFRIDRGASMLGTDLVGLRANVG